VATHGQRGNVVGDGAAEFATLNAFEKRRRGPAVSGLSYGVTSLDDFTGGLAVGRICATDQKGPECLIIDILYTRWR
jgi:hypothetical protein